MNLHQAILDALEGQDVERIMKGHCILLVNPQLRFGYNTGEWLDRMGYTPQFTPEQLQAYVQTDRLYSVTLRTTYRTDWVVLGVSEEWLLQNVQDALRNPALIEAYNAHRDKQKQLNAFIDRVEPTRL